MDNQRKVNRVAAAICHQAGRGPKGDNPVCAICEGVDSSSCVMVEQFRLEALAAIRAMKGGVS